MTPELASFPERPRRASEAAFREVPDEGGLVVLPTRSEVKVLNPVASRIFGLLDGEHTQERIVDILVEEFDVSGDQARRDLLAFLAELDREGMLAREGEANNDEEGDDG